MEEIDVEEYLEEFDLSDKSEADLIISRHKYINDHLTIVVIPNDERRTSSILQLEELTEAIGIRASQIESGSPIFTDIEGISDPKLIASKELIDRKNPLIIERPINRIDNILYVEQWKVRDMTYIDIDKNMLDNRLLAEKKWKSNFQFKLRTSFKE